MSFDKKDSQHHSFLGQGWSFPPRFLLEAGEVAMTTDEADIEASLNVLLGTVAGERFMHPKYGLNMREILFDPMSTTAQTLLKDRIKTVLLIYESRINVLAIDIDKTELYEGRLILNIDYEIRATNSRFNLVYPFYVNDGTEVSAIP